MAELHKQIKELTLKTQGNNNINNNNNRKRQRGKNERNRGGDKAPRASDLVHTIKRDAMWKLPPLSAADRERLEREVGGLSAALPGEEGLQPFEEDPLDPGVDDVIDDVSASTGAGLAQGPGGEGPDLAGNMSAVHQQLAQSVQALRMPEVSKGARCQGLAPGCSPPQPHLLFFFF